MCTSKEAAHVAIGTDSIHIIDTGGSTAPGIIHEVGEGGGLTPVATIEPIDEAEFVAVDPVNGDRVIADSGRNRGTARVVRVDPDTGLTTDMLTNLDMGVGAIACVDVSPDGTRLVVTDENAGRVYVFTRTLPCSDSDFDGVCDEADLCPGGDDGIDVNTNDVPDACDVPVDYDGDGNLNLADWEVAADCVGWPDVPASPPCQTTFDIDEDGDVDLAGLALLQQLLGG